MDVPSPDRSLESAPNAEPVAAVLEANPPAKVPTTKSMTYGWANVYGWLYLGASLYLLAVALITVALGTDLTPASVPLGHSKQIGAVSALVQGLLFGATGLAVVRKRKIAVTLVWASTALAGLGVLARGVIPVDLILWLVDLWTARWFSKKSPLLR